MKKLILIAALCALGVGTSEAQLPAPPGPATWPHETAR